MPPIHGVAPGQQLKKVGKIDVGTVVMAPREEGEEFERCTVRILDSATGMLDLAFEDGFLRKNVDVATVGILPENQHDADSDGVPLPISEENKKAASDAAYDLAVGPTLPTPMTKDMLTADAEAKYAYIKAYKDAGNALFKAGKYAWAITTYRRGVDALAEQCYESRERMLWDYFARGPCGQCYSNAALCALKLEDFAEAVELCDLAMSCRPEDTDLVKVLLRRGQALLGLQRPEEAKEVLEKAADKEPSNRSVREELVKAKKAVKEIAKAADARLFQNVDLTKKGLTSKKDEIVETLKTNLEKGFEELVEHKNEEALKLLEPLLTDKAADLPHRKPSTMLAAYGIGVAKYHQKKLKACMQALGFFFHLRAALDADGVEYTPPLMGVPLARFYYAHALFESQQLEEARQALLAFLDDVRTEGPQRILNMPAGMGGTKTTITEAERAASRFKVRASSLDAQGDANTMLGVITERMDGPQAALPYFEKVLALATGKMQLAEAHANLSRTHGALKMQGDEQTIEHQRLEGEHHRKSNELRYQHEKDEAEKAKKKEEEAAKEAEEEAQSKANDPLPEVPETWPAEPIPDVSEK